jgi:hypothetical protein
MRKSLLLGMGVFTLAACAPYPYPGPGPRFWGPREEVFFAYTLTTLAARAEALVELLREDP